MCILPDNNTTSLINFCVQFLSRYHFAIYLSDHPIVVNKNKARNHSNVLINPCNIENIALIIVLSCWRHFYHKENKSTSRQWLLFIYSIPFTMFTIIIIYSISYVYTYIHIFLQNSSITQCEWNRRNRTGVLWWRKFIIVAMVMETGVIVLHGDDVYIILFSIVMLSQLLALR